VGYRTHRARATTGAESTMTRRPSQRSILPFGLMVALVAGQELVRASRGASMSSPEEAPATQSLSHDFDFEFGAWTVHLSRLLEPLTGSSKWVEYKGTSVVRKVWNGRANLGELEVEGPAGRIEGLSLRLFDPQSGRWNIHWASSRDGALGEAMVGGFRDGVGEFFDQEMYGGRPIEVRFIFSDITPTSFRLEQAFSDDGGTTWEANWIARFER
jgi:hypothetical protein